MKLQVCLTVPMWLHDDALIFIPAGSIGTVEGLTEAQGCAVVEVRFERAVLRDRDGTRVVPWCVDVPHNHLVAR